MMKSWSGVFVNRHTSLSRTGASESAGRIGLSAARNGFTSASSTVRFTLSGSGTISPSCITDAFTPRASRGNP